MRRVALIPLVSLVAGITVFALLLWYFAVASQYDLLLAVVVSATPSVLIGLALFATLNARQSRKIVEWQEAERVRMAEKEADGILKLQATVEAIRELIPQVAAINPHTSRNLAKLCDHVLLVLEKMQEKHYAHAKDVALGAHYRLEPLAPRTILQYLEMHRPDRMEYFPDRVSIIAEVEKAIAGMEVDFRNLVTLLEKSDLDDLALDLQIMNPTSKDRI